MPGRAWKRVGLPCACAGLLLAASLGWPVPEHVLTGGRVLSVRFTDRTGGLLREWRPEGRGQPVPLADVAPAVRHAVVAVEDRRFHVHHGVDVRAIGRAFRDNARQGEVVSGASTLTMQVARALRGRTHRGLWDKLAEVHLALRLERQLSKDAILALWLNRVSFGNQAHGIEAAAQLYFGRAARDLTFAEATFLVGLPQSPSRYNPYRHRARADARWHRVLDALVETGHLTSEGRAAVEAVPPRLAHPEAPFAAAHLTERLTRAELPGTAVEVQTTLDAAVQAEADALVGAHLHRMRGAGATNAALIVLDNATGDVLAYVGSRDFFDEASKGQNDGVTMLRQPGSALKPFTYALAFQSRRTTPATVLPDLELAVPEAGGAFRPENYDRTFHGPVPARAALASSFNVPAIVLAREIGPAALLAAYRRMGFSMLTRPADVYGVGLTLGNGEVTLEALASAYAGLAGGGQRPLPRYVRRFVTARGDTLRPPPAARADMGLEPAVAFLVADILRDPEARAGGFGRGGPLELPFPAAVKTGTSKDYRDNWAVGFTPRHTVAVWVGNFDGTPMQRVSGVSGAAPLLRAMLTYLGPAGDFVPPPGVREAVVCPHGGARPTHACPGTQRVWMLADATPADTCTVHRLVALDRRTGLLADAATPPGAVAQRRYTDYGPRYHEWMAANGLPRPPQIRHADLRGADGTLRTSDRLAITYPAPGARVLRDPHLRAEYQRLALRARADETLLDPRWYVDGREAGRGLSLDWTLEPGARTFEVRAVTPEGQRLRSRPVRVTVE